MQKNEEEIADDDYLYRRLQSDAVSVDEDGKLRVNSLAYGLRVGEDGVSVNLGRLTTEQQTLAEGDKPGLGLGRIRAGDVRACGLTIQHKPDVAHNNPAHTLMIPAGKLTKKQRRNLAKATELLIPPTASEIISDTDIESSSEET